MKRKRHDAPSQWGFLAGEEIRSSRTRLRLAELMSIRPRSLKELAELTGLSVPGVLRHLDALGRAGILRESKISSKVLPVRKTYALKGVSVADFSIGDLSIVGISRTKEDEKWATDQSLERLAGEILIGRRRIREKARHLARAIEDHIDNESRLVKAIDSLDLEEDERLILLTAYTEETLADAEKILESEGIAEARRSIESALSKAKRIVDK